MRKVINYFYHPSRARLLYDLFSSFLIVAVITLLLILFGVNINYPVRLLTLPFIYTFINHSYGVYTNYKQSNVILKTFLITYAGITTAAFLYLLQADILVTLLSTFFSVLLGLAARWFTNLPHQHLKSEGLSYIISDNMPVLIVGGAGYIGSHVVKQLVESGERVRVFDKFYYGERLKNSLEKNSKIEVIEGDISDLYSLTMALENVKSVVHLAGIVGDPASAIDKNLTKHINIVTTRMLKETVKAFRIPRFIFASSCSVYGASDEIVNENSKLNPVSLYAQTKIDSEGELLNDPHDFFHPTILRFATVFGHSERMRFDLVANLFAAHAYHNGVISVFGGEQYRPFIHVSDIAMVIVKSLKYPKDIVGRQIYNVGDDSMNVSIEDLASVVQSVIKKDKRGKKVKIAVNKKIDDPRNYHVSFQKIKSKLNFESSYNFEEGITEILDHLKKGGYKKNYKDSVYSNYETTKNIQKEFLSKEYQQKHFTTIAAGS